MVKKAINTLLVTCIMIIKLSQDLLEKIKNEFDSKPVYNKKFLKTKIKSHDDKVSDFSNKKFLMWTLIILI